MAFFSERMVSAFSAHDRCFSPIEDNYPYPRSVLSSMMVLH